MAVADHRKAIVLAFRDRVDLVATPRAMLAHPQLAGPRVDGHTLVVADAQRVDLRPGSLAADEWIVPGNRSVGVDAQHFPHEAVELLRLQPIPRS